MPPDKESTLHVAYLTSVYPKLSHSFIASEIAGLRHLGVKVETFSVNRPAPEDLRSPDARDEQGRTTYLIGTVRRHLPALAGFVLRRPDVLVAGVVEALRFCRGAARGKRPFYLLEALVLVRELSRREVRHVHVHLANNAADVAHLAVTMGSRLDRRRWSWSLAVHGPNELLDVGAYNLARKAASAELVACITDFCRSQLMMLLPASHWAKLQVVRMGIDLDAFPIVERSRTPGAPLRVLFVGRLVAEKAPQLLIEAAARFKPGRIEVRIVGSGSLDDELAAQVATLGMAASVELAGASPQHELPAHYGWADVFCLPSFAEGLPVVIMEAMATGLPIISTSVAGIPELIDNGRTGLLVAPGNVDDLESALHQAIQLIQVPGRAAEARAAVADRHSSLNNARALARHLSEISE